MIDDTSDRFVQCFGRPNTAMGQAPGRVNLIGEHIDYNGGTVLPMALSCQSVIKIAPNEHDMLQIGSETYSEVVERSIDELALGHWSDLIVGTVQKARDLGLVRSGLDIYIESSVPQGAGVSSSASLATSLFRALMKQAETALPIVDVAKAARAVENDYMGVPCGIMDQMAVGLLAPGEALALNTTDLSTETISIPDGWVFSVLHSGIRRQLSDGRYRERFQECEHAARKLGIKHLCDGDLDAIDILPPTHLKRARHVITENNRTGLAIQALKDANFQAFGALMNNSHLSYAHDFEASKPEIDVLVEAARAEGAIGARLTGGGFGGCIVCLLRTNKVENWTQRMLDTFPNAWRVE